MVSHQQMIVGVLLLACAFIFGRYIHTKPLESVSEFSALVEADESAEKLPNTNIFRRADTPESVESNLQSATEPRPNALQQSLRERILGKRTTAKKQNPPASVPATSSPNKLPANGFESTQAKKLNGFKDKIVQPDFSHLDSLASTPVELQSERPQMDLKMPPRQSPQQFPLDHGLVGPLQNTRPKFALQNQDFNSTDIRDRPARLRPETSQVIALRPPRDINTRLQPQQDRGSTSSKSRLTKVQQRSHRLSVIAKDCLTYTSATGDTLHSISSKYYGKPDYYLDIYVANRDRLPNPSIIPTGLKLKIPVYSH